MAFKYRESVLAELARHGVAPRDDTPPDLVHDFINDLYRYEIRALRSRLVAGQVPKSEYAARVEALRNRYPVLGLHVRFWASEDNKEPVAVSE
jgi:hypothetical protein